MKPLRKMHPVVILIFYLSVMTVTMITLNPVILGLSLVTALLYSLTFNRSVKTYLSYLLLFILVSLINPLISHNGDTILFYIAKEKVTLEALYYGMAMATMFITIFIWANCLNHDLTSEKILFLFGKFAPRTTLTLTTSIRFIPLFTHHMKNVMRVQKTLGLYDDSIVDKIKSTLRSFASTLTWSLENSIDTADSMKARGYGITKRTTFSLFHLMLSDILLMLIIITADIFLIVLGSNGEYAFNYYPTMQNIKIISWSYIPAIVLLFIPFIKECEETLRWKLLKSKI